MPAKPTIVDEIKNELRTLDSKINLIVQKLRTLENNQQIVGQTLLNLKAQVKPGSGPAQKVTAGVDPETEKRIKELELKIKEMTYVIDSINPLEYATLDQVKELMDEKIGKR